MLYCHETPTLAASRFALASHINYVLLMEGLSKDEGVCSGVVSYKPAQFLYETVLSHINCEAKLQSLLWHPLSEDTLGWHHDLFELNIIFCVRLIYVSYKSGARRRVWKLRLI